MVQFRQGQINGKRHFREPMKIIISPAKSLDFTRKVPQWADSLPAPFLYQTDIIAKRLSSMSRQEVIKTLKLSPKVIEEAMSYIQEFSIPFPNDKSKQAIFLFAGSVYKAIDVETMDKEQLFFLQNHLRIVSGIYGILTPFTQILPYRLEMGTNLRVGRHKNLYQFWGAKIAKNLISQMHKGETLIDLSGKEYSKAVTPYLKGVNIVTPVFLDRKGDDYKICSIYAKTARGKMVRYIAQNKVQDYNELVNFEFDRYVFSKSMSSSSELVFVRN